MNAFFLASCVSLATSRDRFKGVQNLGGGLFGARLLSSSLSPIGAMFHDPIEQGSFKADVFAGFFAFDPFMLQNLRALGEELLVESRILDELSLIFFRRWHLGFLFFHKTCVESTKSRIRIRRVCGAIYLTLLCATGCGRRTTPTPYADFLRSF